MFLWRQINYVNCVDSFGIDFRVREIPFSAPFSDFTSGASDFIQCNLSVSPLSHTNSRLCPACEIINTPFICLEDVTVFWVRKQED